MKQQSAVSQMCLWCYNNNLKKNSPSAAKTFAAGEAFFSKVLNSPHPPPPPPL